MASAKRRRSSGGSLRISARSASLIWLAYHSIYLRADVRAHARAREMVGRSATLLARAVGRVVRAHPLCHEDQHTLDLRIPIEPCSRLGNPARLEAKPLPERRLRIGGCLPLQNCNRGFEALKESDFLHRSALQMPRGPCGIQTSLIPV